MQSVATKELARPNRDAYRPGIESQLYNIEVTPQDLEKYSRQVLFAPLGRDGQERLLASRAVVLGCGALGSFSSAALVRAGVGHVIVVDRDYVEPSNLQRQSLYDERDAAECLPKAAAAEIHLRAINSGVIVEGRIADVTPENIESLIAGADVILDGTDNFETRYLLNDAAVKLGIPWIYAAAVGSYGVTMPVLPGRTKCLACVFPAPPSGPQETCDTMGILASAVSAVASFQVTNAIKVMIGAEVEPRLLSIDVWQNRISTLLTRTADPSCDVCGQRQFRHLAGEGRPAITLCGRNSVQIHEHDRPVDLTALSRRLQPLGTVRANSFVLMFCPDPETSITLFSDGRAIIKGTDDPGIARSLYARYVGS